MGSASIHELQDNSLLIIAARASGKARFFKASNA